MPRLVISCSKNRILSALQKRFLMSLPSHPHPKTTILMDNNIDSFCLFLNFTQIESVVCAFVFALFWLTLWELQTVKSNCILLICITVLCSIMWVDYKFFSKLLLVGILGSLYFGVFTNSAIKVLVNAFWRMYVETSVGCIPRNEIAGL